MIAISAGFYHSLALKSNGTVVGWGSNGSGQIAIPSGLSGVKAIFAGGLHSMALKNDGTIVPRGETAYGQSTIPASIQGSATAIADGYVHSIALKSDGTVVGWGDNRYGELNIPAGLNKVVAVSTTAGALHSLALKSDGTVVGWGDTCCGQLNIPAGLKRVFAISAGGYQSLTLVLNQLATVTNDSYTTNEDTALTINAPGVLANDSDADKDALTAVKASDPAHGTVTLNSNGSFTYTPTANYNGPDSFTYRANDGLANSNVATVTIRVNAVNDAPTALSLSNTSVAENQPAGTTVGTFSTTDPDVGDAFTYTLVAGTGSADNASFTIAGSALKTAASFDFEAKSSYTIRVRSTDRNGAFIERAFTITVSDVADTATPTVTNTPTNTPMPPTATATDMPTATATNTPANTPTATATDTAVSSTGTPVATDTPTNTPTNSPTDTAVPATDTSTNTPTATATDTAVPATDTPTNTPTATATDTAVPATDTPTNTPTATATDTAVPATDTPTETSVPATSTPTNTPTSGPSFPGTSVLDTFNRANGSVGANWNGLTNTSFYKIANNTLDVQLGGPLVWKADTFGTNQEAFVTLSTIDTHSPSQGLILKAQTGTIPDAGAILVVYDAQSKGVRVSTLRAGQKGAWTLYPTKAATFANGDVLGARAKANGTIEIYKNSTLITTVTLNTADQAFFNAKGGKIGIWTAAALNAVMDDFGGGTATP